MVPQKYQVQVEISGTLVIDVEGFIEGVQGRDHKTGNNDALDLPAGGDIELNVEGGAFVWSPHL